MWQILTLVLWGGGVERAEIYILTIRKFCLPLAVQLT